MSKPKAGKRGATVYRLGPTIFVPHYTVEGVFVGPGYPRQDAREWSASQLVDRGAKCDTYPLSERPRVKADRIGSDA